jgi:N-methylhydantoinase A
VRAASDVGGTFTDLVYYPVDPETGRPGAVQVAKADTTPPEFEQGVMNAMAKAGFARRAGFLRARLHRRDQCADRAQGCEDRADHHGGLPRRDRDRAGQPADLFNFNFRKPRPFVDRYLRAELVERSNFRGDLVKPVDLAPLPALLDFFRAEGVEAIAVAFLHAYVNPENERRTVGGDPRRPWPGVAVLASHEVSREWREYERTNTTVLSAYVSPIARRYIERLEQRLADGGFARSLT